jgi:hypothetical protein
MELFKWVINAVCIKVFKEIFPGILSYIKQNVREPLFWVILIIIIGLVIIGIIHERREKKSERRRAPKETEGNSDKKVICHYCNGYGKLMDKGKGRKKGTICPHCSGTGWITEE